MQFFSIACKTLLGLGRLAHLPKLALPPLSVDIHTQAH